MLAFSLLSVCDSRTATPEEDEEEEVMKEVVKHMRCRKRGCELESGTPGWSAAAKVPLSAS